MITAAASATWTTGRRTRTSVTSAAGRTGVSRSAARILAEAWVDPDWGTLVWVAIVTGVRRGELCALRWRDVDLSTGVLSVSRSIGQRNSETWEKDTKDHQHRRIAVDEETVGILAEYRRRLDGRCAVLGVRPPADAHVFSLAPDNSTYMRPNSVSERYSDLADRLGIATSLHKLRHYSATELIAAGVDIRTVAGRLGHAGGGTTTLRVYAAWVSESDQRAAANLGARMPTRRSPHVRRARDSAAARQPFPYEVVASATARPRSGRSAPEFSTCPAGSILGTRHDLDDST